jgi:hypothetical protein
VIHYVRPHKINIPLLFIEEKARIDALCRVWVALKVAIVWRLAQYRHVDRYDAPLNLEFGDFAQALDVVENVFGAAAGN